MVSKSQVHWWDNFIEGDLYELLCEILLPQKDKGLAKKSGKKRQGEGAVSAKKMKKNESK